MKKKLIAIAVLLPLLASCGGEASGKETVHKAIDAFDATGAAALAKYDTGVRKSTDDQFKYLDDETEGAVTIDQVYAKLGYPTGNNSSEFTIVHSQLAFASVMVTDPLVQPSVTYIESQSEKYNVEQTYETGDNEYRVYTSYAETVEVTLDNGNKVSLGKATYLEIKFNEVGLVTFIDETYAYAKQDDGQKEPTLKFAYRHQVSYTWKVL